MKLSRRYKCFCQVEGRARDWCFARSASLVPTYKRHTATGRKAASKDGEHVCGFSRCAAVVSSVWRVSRPACLEAASFSFGAVCWPCGLCGHLNTNGHCCAKLNDGGAPWPRPRHEEVGQDGDAEAGNACRKGTDSCVQCLRQGWAPHGNLRAPGREDHPGPKGQASHGKEEEATGHTPQTHREAPA